MSQPSKKQTSQEIFWSGEFGDNYIERNQGDQLLASNLNFFNTALGGCENLNSCVEFGANIGMNLRAMKLLFPNIQCSGIEINKQAASQLKKLIGDDSVFNGSISDFNPASKADLALIKGVLIHISPTQLREAYEKLHQASKRYILIAEY